MDGLDSNQNFLDEESRPCVIEIPTIVSDNTNFARLGIEFAPFAKGDKLRGARLPDGWVVEKINKISYYIVDNNGAKRAKLIANGSHKTDVYIMPRFSAGLDTTMKDANIRARFCVWDQKKNGDKVVFEVSYPVPNKARNKAAYERSVKIYAEKQECKQWLDEHFPDWENPVAYWDEE